MKKFVMGFLLLALCVPAMADDLIVKHSASEVEITTTEKTVVDVKKLKSTKNGLEKRIGFIQEQADKQKEQLQKNLDRVNKLIDQAKKAGVE